MKKVCIIGALSLSICGVIYGISPTETITALNKINAELSTVYKDRMGRPAFDLMKIRIAQLMTDCQAVIGEKASPDAQIPASFVEEINQLIALFKTVKGENPTATFVFPIGEKGYKAIITELENQFKNCIVKADAKYKKRQAELADAKSIADAKIAADAKALLEAEKEQEEALKQALAAKDTEIHQAATAQLAAMQTLLNDIKTKQAIFNSLITDLKDKPTVEDKKALLTNKKPWLDVFTTLIEKTYETWYPLIASETDKDAAALPAELQTIRTQVSDELAAINKDLNSAEEQKKLEDKEKEIKDKFDAAITAFQTMLKDLGTGNLKAADAKQSYKKIADDAGTARQEMANLATTPNFHMSHDLGDKTAALTDVQADVVIYGIKDEQEAKKLNLYEYHYWLAFAQLIKAIEDSMAHAMTNPKNSRKTEILIDDTDKPAITKAMLKVKAAYDSLLDENKKALSTDAKHVKNIVEARIGTKNETEINRIWNSLYIVQTFLLDQFNTQVPKKLALARLLAR